MCSQNVFTDGVHDFKNVKIKGLLSPSVSTIKIFEKASPWG